MIDVSNSEKAQRAYYAAHAKDYSNLHVSEPGEHEVALNFLVAMLDDLKIESVLDVGSGTGRALARLGAAVPRLRLVGVEPVAELREVGYSSGLARESLVDGNALALDFEDGSFDLVCAFGLLHHLPDPSTAVKEMLRVGKRAVFISDANNFGQGSPIARSVKQTLDALRLWPLADWVRTGGKGYMTSASDGVFYSYSVFNDYQLLEKQCSTVHVLNTRGYGRNPYRQASHVALLGVKG